MKKPKRRKPHQLEACSPQTPYKHSVIAWTCRGCGRQACAHCAHHFGTARTTVTLFKPHDRIFSCSRCAGGRSLMKVSKTATTVPDHGPKAVPDQGPEPEKIPVPLTDEEIRAEVYVYLTDNLMKERQVYERQVERLANDRSPRSVATRKKDEETFRWSRLFIEEVDRIASLITASEMKPNRATPEWRASFNAALAGAMSWANASELPTKIIVQQATEAADLAYLVYTQASTEGV